MKFFITVLALTALLLTGCAAQQGAAAEGAERMLRSAGDALHNAAGEASVVTESGTTRLTKDQAEAIVLEHAGFAPDQVSGLRTEFEIDDGVPRYEIQFRQGRWEYDYEINANTGDILSYDRDD